MTDIWIYADIADELEIFGTYMVKFGVAVALSGLVGIERRLHGRWAGIRTHMAVAMGAALFTIIGMEISAELMGDSKTRGIDPTRIVQGIATGIGFLGAGTILKLSKEVEVKGLTTASTIWLSAALGTACGLERYSLAVAATVVSLLVLAVLRPLDKKFFGAESP
ncbi:MAG: MgtC/SapB family protein [Planctomycetes bacterium]|nr:MgtC/SapB family protein [Planctomycetota bacterium]